MNNKIFKSSIFGSLEIIIAVALSLIITPYLIENLGSERYGLWILVLASLGWFNVIDLGFSFSVSREIILSIEKNNRNQLNKIFSVALVLFSILGAVAFLGVMLLSYNPKILGVDQNNYHVASITLSILAFKVFFDFLMNSFHGFFAAFLRLDIAANISTLNTIIKALLVYFLILEWNIYGAVFATIIADVITHCIRVYFARKLYPNFSFKFQLVTYKEIRRLFNYSKHLVANGIAKSINTKSDPIIISHFLGLKYVAIYNIINSLVMQVESLVTAIIGVFYPLLTKVVARGNGFSSQLIQIFNINFLIVILLYVPLAILAENFIYLWIGADFVSAAILAIPLGFAYICKSVSRPISSLLLAQANHKLLALGNLLGAMINIIVSLLLISHWGLIGVAFATSLSFFITDVIFHLFLLKKYTDIGIKQIIKKFTFILFLYFGSIYIGTNFLIDFVPLTWFGLFGACVLYLAFILIFIFLFYKKYKISLTLFLREL